MALTDVKNNEGTLATSLSVVIPTYNAAGSPARTIASVRWGAEEIVVCDGGSTDGTPKFAAALGAQVVSAAQGRGRQLAAAVGATRGAWLLLLHADTVLETGWTEAVRRFMATDPHRAAYFRLALATEDVRARRLERLVAWRCRRLGLPFGDQGLLISRTLLERVGGIRPMVLMEDVDLVRRIGRARLVGLDVRAVSSPSRWERDGWRRRSARNLACLSLYLAGIPPHVIRKFYE